MIKAAFFDIDGTLVSFNTHTVSPGTIQAFDRLQKKGIKTFISTGRPYCLLPQMPLHVDGYVTMNGGYCFIGDKITHKNPIPQTESDAWVRFAKSNGLCTMQFTEKGMYINRTDDPMLAPIGAQVKIDMPPQRSEDDMIGMETYQFIGIMSNNFDAQIVELLPHCRLPRWNPYFTDIINTQNSKAVGIASIIRQFGINPEECIGFGDGANDVEMLEYCGIGVAMGNAADEVKQHANYVTTSVDEEGIQNALKTLHILDD